MTDEKQKDLAKKPEETTPKPEVEPLSDADLESVSGGLLEYCSAAACSK